MAAEPRIHPERGGELRAALAEVADHVRELLRLELQLAKQELREAVAALRQGLLFLGLSALLSMLALAALLTTVVAALATVWPLWLAAGVVGLVLAGASAGLVLAGSRRLRGETLRPNKTLQSIRETKQWLKART